MENSYIYQDENGKFAHYYFSDNQIIRKDEDGQSVIIDSVRKNFTVCTSVEDDIYIFCQDLDGNIIVTTSENGIYSTKVLFENTFSKKSCIYVHAIIEANELVIFFNTPIGELKQSYIYMQKMKGKVWQKAVIVDMFSPLRDDYFSFIKNADNTYFMIYQMCDNSNNLGARLIKNDSFSNFNIYHTTNYNILEQSSIIVNDAFFTSYVVKSAFSSQLIFRKSTKEGFSNTIVLSEGMSIEKPIIFLGHKLFVFFISGQNVYVVISEDFGDSFDRARKVENVYAESIIKCKFISNNMHDMCISEVYINKNEPRNIRIIPDYYKNFYTDFQKPKAINKTPKIDKTKQKQHNNSIVLKNPADMTNEEFYYLFLQKKKEKERAERELNKNDYEDDEMSVLRAENEKLKKAMKNFIK